MMYFSQQYHNPTNVGGKCLGTEESRGSDAAEHPVPHL